MTSVTRPPIILAAGQARILSVLALSAIVAGYLLDAIFTEMPRAAFVAVGIVKLFGLLGATALFLDAHGMAANAPEKLLDERQRAERGRAFVLSHQIIVSAIFLIFLYTLPAKPLGWWFPSLDDGIDLLSAFGIVGMALPGIILAWRTPRVADSDED